MTDEITGGTDDGSTPATDTPEPDPAPGSTPEADTPEAGGQAGSTPEATAGAQGSDDEPEEWRNLNEKYKHISDEKQRRAAIGKAYFENANGASRVHKENEQLRARVKELEGQPPQPEPEPEKPHPDLQALDERINTLTAEKKRADEGVTTRLDEYQVAKSNLLVLERMRNRDEASRPFDLEQQIAEAKAEKDRVAREWRAEKTYADTLDMQLQHAKREKTLTERELEDTRERQKKAEAERAERMEAFPKQVTGWVSGLVTELKIPDEPKIRDFATRAAEAFLMADLWRMSQGLIEDDVSPDQMLRAYLTEFSSVVDILQRQQFRRESRDKLTVTRPVAGATPAPATATTPPSPAKPRMPWEEDPNSREGNPVLKAARERWRKTVGV